MIELNRFRTALAILAVGTTGVLVTGCGDGSNDSVTKAIDGAQQSVGDQLNQQVEQAKKQGKEKLQKQSEELQKQAEEAIKQAEKPNLPEASDVQTIKSQAQIEAAQKRVQKQIEQAIEQAGK